MLVQSPAMPALAPAPSKPINTPSAPQRNGSLRYPHNPRKQLSPALSTLLTSTTIPAARSRHRRPRTRSSSTLSTLAPKASHDDLLGSSASSISSSISSRRSSSSSTCSTTGASSSTSPPSSTSTSSSSSIIPHLARKQQSAISSPTSKAARSIVAPKLQRPHAHQQHPGLSRPGAAPSHHRIPLEDDDASSQQHIFFSSSDYEKPNTSAQPNPASHYGTLHLWKSENAVEDEDEDDNLMLSMMDDMLNSIPSDCDDERGDDDDEEEDDDDDDDDSDDCFSLGLAISTDPIPNKRRQTRQHAFTRSISLPAASPSSSSSSSSSPDDSSSSTLTTTPVSVSAAVAAARVAALRDSGAHRRLSSPSPSPVARSRSLSRRASIAMLRPGVRVASTNGVIGVSSVDAKSHPLALDDEDEARGPHVDVGYDADDALTSCNESSPATDIKKKSALKKFKSYRNFVSNLTASIKAISMVASSFSSSQQSLISSNDVFKFSPRSTDEPIPRNTGRFAVASASKPKREKAAKLEKPAASPEAVAAAVAAVREAAAEAAAEEQPQPAQTPSAPSRPKAIPMDTYNVQEYAMPAMPRGRDFRENPNFLRIYALESLMKKHGKFDPSFPGKAQVALVPRTDDVPPPACGTLAALACGVAGANNGSGNTDVGAYPAAYQVLYTANHGKLAQPGCSLHYNSAGDGASERAVTSTTLRTLLASLSAHSSPLMTTSNNDKNNSPTTSIFTTTLMTPLQLPAPAPPAAAARKVPSRWVPQLAGV